MATNPIVKSANGRLSEVLHYITDDVKTIARDEVELARIELQRTTKLAATESAIVVLGGIVALIGLGLLCVAAVDALGAIISPLWLRLIIMAVVYLAVGGVVAGVFAKRLKRDAVPDFSTPVDEAKQTVQSAKAGLEH
jgi:hypothetical protein